MATTFLQIEENQVLLDAILQQTKVEVRSLVEQRLRSMAEEVVLEATDEVMRQLHGRLLAAHDLERDRDVFNLTVNLILKVD